MTASNQNVIFEVSFQAWINQTVSLLLIDMPTKFHVAMKVVSGAEKSTTKTQTFQEGLLIAC